jgi:hypothetical protein
MEHKQKRRGVIIQRERKKNIQYKSGVPWEYDTNAECVSDNDEKERKRWFHIIHVKAKRSRKTSTETKS